MLPTWIFQVVEETDCSDSIYNMLRSETRFKKPLGCTTLQSSDFAEDAS